MLWPVARVERLHTTLRPHIHVNPTQFGHLDFVVYPAFSQGQKIAILGDGPTCRTFARYQSRNRSAATFNTHGTSLFLTAVPPGGRVVFCNISRFGFSHLFGFFKAFPGCVKIRSIATSSRRLASRNITVPCRRRILEVGAWSKPLDRKAYLDHASVTASRERLPIQSGLAVGGRLKRGIPLACQVPISWTDLGEYHLALDNGCTSGAVFPNSTSSSLCR